MRRNSDLLLHTILYIFIHFFLLKITGKRSLSLYKKYTCGFSKKYVPYICNSQKNKNFLSSSAKKILYLQNDEVL